MELPYYRYEFEYKKRRLETKRRSDGWLNDEVGDGTICHDSRGNLVDGLGNPIKEEVMEEEKVEKEQDRKRNSDLDSTRTRTGRVYQYTKNLKHISHSG